MLTMNYQGLGDKYSKPKKESYKLGKKYFSASTWKDYKEWMKEQEENEELKKKLSKALKKKRVKNCPSKKKKSNSGSGNSLKSKAMLYTEQLKDERWLKKRKEVMDKKGYICAKCGSRYGLQVHHLKYKSGKMAWEYPMSNFIVLCEKCHKEIHNLN